MKFLTSLALLLVLAAPGAAIARDVPKILRIVPQPQIVTALAAAQTSPELAVAAEFLLAGVSQRLAQSLREEVAARAKVREPDAEEAMGAIIVAVRTLELSGELSLVPEDE